MKSFLRSLFAPLFLLLCTPGLLMAGAAEESQFVDTHGDAWIEAAWEKICELAKSFWEWFSNWIHEMLFTDLGLSEASPRTLIILLVVLAVMLASGAWAASIAQMRRHPALPFFALGFFTFFIGPACLLYNLNIKGEDERKAQFAEAAARKREEEEARAERELAQAKERGKIEAPAVSAEGIVWDQNYFASIQRKEDGTPNGPWTVAYNGIEVTVTEIIEVLPEFLQVRLINLEGMPMVSRIPYSKIEKWDAQA